MQFIVITGLPCAGKSKLVELLRETLHWPVLAKDEFKEQLFDALGYSDRSWSKRVSAAAYALMFAQANELLRCKQRFVLEGNFRAIEHQQSFTALTAQCQTILQVYCTASIEVLSQRFMQRARSGARHPGHVDVESAKEIQHELASARCLALPLPGELIECDTTRDWQTAITATRQKILAWAAAPTSLPPRG